MSTETITKQPKSSRTRILFDLSDVLSEEEISKFETSAKEAGARNLTDHFLNLTLRLPKQERSGE